MIILFFLFISCQSIGLSPKSPQSYLSDIQKLIELRKYSEAKKQLLTFIPTNNILKAQKYHLLGLISSREKKIEESYQYFFIAKEEDPYNESIFFNYLITSLKTSRYALVKKELADKQVESFSLENQKKFYLLGYYLAEYENNHFEMFKNLFHYIKITQKTSSPYIKRLNYLYKNLSSEQQFYLDQNYAPLSSEILLFLKQHPETDAQSSPPLEEQNFQIEFSQKIFIFLHPEVSFSEKIIQTVKLLEKHLENIKIEYLDNFYNVPRGSILIGGLVPSKAAEEFQLAKQLNSFYISLTPLNFEKKGPFCLEIPASLDSQIYALKNYLGSEEILLLSMNNSLIEEKFQKNLVIKKSFEMTLDDLSFSFLKDYEKILSAEEVKKIEERSEELNLKEKSLSLVIKKELLLRAFIYTTKPSDLITILSHLQNKHYSLKNFITGPLAYNTKFQKKITHFYDPSSSEEFNKEFLQEYSSSPGLLAFYLSEALYLAREVQLKNTQSLKTHQAEWFLIDGQWIKKLELKTSLLKL